MSRYSPEDAYREMVGRTMSTEQIRRLIKFQRILGLQEDDAVWALMLIFEAYNDLFNRAGRILQTRILITMIILGTAAGLWINTMTSTSHHVSEAVQTPHFTADALAPSYYGGHLKHTRMDEEENMRLRADPDVVVYLSKLAQLSIKQRHEILGVE